MLKVINISIFLLIINFILYAQEEKPKTIYDFRIYEGVSEENDVTKWLLDSEMHTLFYLYEKDSLLMMANIGYKSGTQSYGRITTTKDSEFGIIEEGHEIEIYYFDWQYINDYDDETGLAKVKAIIETKSDATYLTLTIVPNDLSIIVYKGIIDGVPDL